MIDNGSELCFWHNPLADKTGSEIKEQLEDKYTKDKNLEGVCLKKANLNNIFLIKANLQNADLRKIDLSNAHLYKAELKNANLFKANLDCANLKLANLTEAELLGVNFGLADLDGMNLGEHSKLRNESDGDILRKEGKKVGSKVKYFESEEIYRDIKNNLKNRGLSSEGGNFFYREMKMKRARVPFF